MPIRGRGMGQLELDLRSTQATPGPLRESLGADPGVCRRRSGGQIQGRRGPDPELVWP